MTQRFNKAMPYIFEHEGGYNNHIEDAGGATNWGISLRFLESIGYDVDYDGDIDWMDIKALKKEEAEQLYFDNFWKPIYDRLIYDKLGIKLFDTAINMGTVQANRLLQKALNSLGAKLKVDGLIGQNTLNEAIKYNEGVLLEAFSNEQKNFYLDLIEKKPSQIKFKNGWIKRANWIPN